MDSFISKIIKNKYVEYKKGLTFDCTNPNNENEVLFEIGDLIILNGEEIFSKYKRESNKPGFIYNYKNKVYHQILNVEGTRNHRYRLYLNDFENPQIISSIDPGLESQLNDLINSKYYSNLKK